MKRHSLSPLTATGQTGLLYRHRDRAIESDARVFVTAAQSARAFSILSSIGLGRCLASSLAAELSHQASGLKATVSNVEPLSFAGLAAPVRGTNFGVRLRGSYEVKSVNYVFLAVRRGRAVATLGLVRYNADWPNSFVRPLATVMAERMTKP